MELTVGVLEIGRRLTPGSHPSDDDHRLSMNASSMWWGRDAIVELRGTRLRRWLRYGGAWALDVAWHPDTESARAIGLAGGHLVLLEPDALVVLDSDGRPVRTIGVPGGDWRTLAVRPGGYLLASPTGHCVVSLDARGTSEHRWNRSDGLIEPWGLDVRADGAAFVVADARRHQVLEYSFDGAMRELAGTAHHAGNALDRLDAPVSVAYSGGGVLIADTKNDRVLNVSDGRVSQVATSFPLWHPRSLARGPGGELLITEGRGGRVIVSSDDSSLVIDGEIDVEEVSLGQPRGAEFLSPRRLLMADCRNNRGLEIRDDGRVLAELATHADLDWPRHVARTSVGYIIADGRNGRLVVLDGTGTLTAEWHTWRTPEGREVAFEDPHHVAPTEGNLLLVTDSQAGSVVLLGPDRVARRWWVDLEDPHVAEWLGRGILVCETGRDRLVQLDLSGERVGEVGAAHVARETGTALSRPRGFARIDSNDLLIVDTGNDRLLMTSGDRVRDLTPRLRSAAGSLFFPRHVALDPEKRRIVISDFDNHRLLVVDVAWMLAS